MSDKYVVFKREDWEESGVSRMNALPQPIEDAVVIRRQDVFAPPALDAYANSISVALALLPEEVELDGKTDLQEIADYFADQAAQSWQTDRKIPD